MADIGRNNVGGAARIIVDEIQSELDELAKQKQELALRARNLRRHLSPRMSKAKRRRKVKRDSSRSAHSLDDKLKRACRIAVMDAGGTATLDEIYARVLRRGSFSFGEDNEHPPDSIALVLGAMVSSGELEVTKRDGDETWYRLMSDERSSEITEIHSHEARQGQGAIACEDCGNNLHDRKNQFSSVS